MYKVLGFLMGGGGGWHRGSIAQWLAPCSIPSIRCCWGESTVQLRGSGQWLENVDQNHLLLASNKLVLQIFFFKALKKAKWALLCNTLILYLRPITRSKWNGNSDVFLPNIFPSEFLEDQISNLWSNSILFFSSVPFSKFLVSSFFASSWFSHSGSSYS